MQPPATSLLVSVEESGAFIERFSLPPTGEGALSGLRFAVKDIIDVAGYATGCGNPTWLATHPTATVSALCVEQLRAAGGSCDGKTITDEVAFSLIGENHFYGTPLNPAAPDRVPGGSSSGSASAVACGLVDFAIGSDTGGSVRVPASNCGIWGLRPTHGVISVAGVLPFAPTFDTIGVFAREADVLVRAAQVLLGGESVPRPAPARIHLAREAFELANESVRAGLAPAVEALRAQYPGRVQSSSLAEICSDSKAADFGVWFRTYCSLQWGEIASSLGAWIAAARPEFGPATKISFEMVNGFDRSRLAEVIIEREGLARGLARGLAADDLLCIPTTPAGAPLKNSGQDRRSDYYRRALSLTSLAGIGRLPQVSIPVATVGNVPIGLSLVGARGQDMHLLAVAKALAAHLSSESAER
jgi:amidase